jgi:hypothetical protein
MSNLTKAFILWAFVAVFITIKYIFGFEHAVFYALALIYNNQHNQ